MNTLPQTHKACGPVSATEEALARYEPQARAIQETWTASVLAACAGGVYGDEFGPCAFKKYHDNTLAAAGQPTDPIEVMLVQQLLLAHHRIGDLHLQAAKATTTEAAAVFNSAAARLMTEFRKTSLALREYRTPVAPKHVTVVKQQNLAAGDQQIAFVDGNAPVRPGPETNHNIELASNRQEAITHAPHAAFVPQSQAGRSRTPEPVIARGADTSRLRAIAAGGDLEPTVAAIHRPENGSRKSSVRGKRAFAAEGR